MGNSLIADLITEAVGRILKIRITAGSYQPMKLHHSPLILISLFLVACSTQPMEEREISVSQVPPEVLEAAREAVPGFEATDAEIEFIYELDGEANGKAYEIEISPDGEVKEIEAKDDE